MSRDYRARLGGNKGKKEELERYKNCRFVKGQLRYTDMIYKNIDNAFDSLDIILNNSNYQYSDLKKMYVVEFYKILRKIEKKLRKAK